MYQTIKYFYRFILLALTVALCVLIAFSGDREIVDKHKFYGFAPVKALDYTADLKMVATGSEIGSVVWDSQKQEVLYTFAGATKKVVFSPDETQLIAVVQESDRSSNRAQIFFYDLQDGKLQASWIGTNPRYSPDGKRLAFAAGKTLRLASLPTAKDFKQYNLPAKITAIAFAPDSQSIAVGTEDGTAYLYSLERDRAIETYPGNSRVIEVVFTPLNSWLRLTKTVIVFGLTLTV